MPKTMTDFKPKDGFQYVEIKFPDRGVTIDGAMDDKSIEKIVSIALNAECDRDYVRPAPDKIMIDLVDPAPVDTEILKLEDSLYKTPPDPDEYENGWNDCIDYLDERGLIGRPAPGIAAALQWAINIYDDPENPLEWVTHAKKALKYYEGVE